jgi:hypothetical protein
VSLVTIAALSLLLSSATAQPGDGPLPIHLCELNSQNIPENNQGLLHASKAFDLQGRALGGMQVRWESYNPSFVRAHENGGSATARVEWPGSNRFRMPSPPFDWENSEIRIDYRSPSTQNRYQPLDGEEWRQFIVDRNQSILIHNQERMSTLLLSGLNLHLVSELEPLSGSAALIGSPESLIAWGKGARRVTVYEVMATRRRPRRNSYPIDPVQRRRIIAAYDLDGTQLEQSLGQVREAVERWEQEIASTWSQCERVTGDGAVVVTESGVTPPAARNSL